MILKLQVLLKDSQLKEASAFAKQSVDHLKDSNQTTLKIWYARVLGYQGNESQARSILKAFPDNQEAREVLRNLRKFSELKDEASSLFKREEY